MIETLINLKSKIMKKLKFVLYTNPNNVTNRAYTASGAMDVKRVLNGAREYRDSYQILYQGKGTAEDIKKVQSAFSYYQF
jgi:hypothetical protein